MFGVSDQWGPAVRGGAVLITAKAEVYGFIGDRLASSEQHVDPYPKLQIVDGSVDVDVNAATRRRATVTFNDSDGVFAPSRPTDLLANESGHEIRLWRGFIYPDGTTELVPLGVFGFSDDDTTFQLAEQTVQVTLFDRSRRISVAGFVDTYTIPAGTNYVTAIEALLRAKWPGIVISSTPTAFTTPLLTYDEQDDPWKVATDMAAKIGYDLYFDVAGICQLNRLLAIGAAAVPVFDYSEGKSSALLGGDRRASNEGQPNGVIMTGASSSNGVPPRGVAWDIDPASATYSGYDPATKTFGPTPYGARPKFVTSSLLTSSAQCTAAAQAELLTVVGRHEQLEFDALVNAAHEARDLVKVKRALAKIDAVYELQAFTIPLRGDSTMKVTTKQRKAA